MKKYLPTFLPTDTCPESNREFATGSFQTFRNQAPFPENSPPLWLQVNGFGGVQVDGNYQQLVSRVPGGFIILKKSTPKHWGRVEININSYVCSKWIVQNSISHLISLVLLILTSQKKEKIYP